MKGCREIPLFVVYSNKSIGYKDNTQDKDFANLRKIKLINGI